MNNATTLDAFLDGPDAARRAILADLDGCLIADGAPLPGAARLSAHAGVRLSIVSNNSSDTATTLSAQLARLRLHVPPERIFLAGEITIRRVAAQHPGARAAIYASAPLQALARDCGLMLDRCDPELTVLARAPGFDIRDLAGLMAQAARGTPVWLTNPDPYHPGPDGTPRPETGALWAALRAAIPTLEPAGMLGKPAPDLLHAAIRAAGVPANEAVFLGDTASTDGRAACAAGIDFVLLRRPGAPARQAAMLREATQC